MVDIIVKSVVAGIHKTKIGANREVRLLVEIDDSVPHIDPNCMLVRVPALINIPQRLHGAISYPKSRSPRDPRQTDQLVRQTAGKKVGNVPSNLCGLFRRLKNQRKVRDIHW